MALCAARRPALSLTFRAPRVSRIPLRAQTRAGAHRRLAPAHPSRSRLTHTYSSADASYQYDDDDAALVVEAKKSSSPLRWERDVVKLRSASELGAHYNMGPVVGRGTFGVVQSAVCWASGAEIAVKTSQKRLQPHAKREITLSSRVDHPNVLRPLRVLETDHEVFMVSELCRGGELFDFVADHNLYLGTLDEESVLRLTREMLVALEACHRAGFAHLDVKPENFVFRAPWRRTAGSEAGSASASASAAVEHLAELRGNLVLIDFGASQPFRKRRYASTSAMYDKGMDDEFRGSAAAALGGTASYVSPEVTHGFFSSRSDLWSLGVSLFMLIAGRRPFDAFDAGEQGFQARPSVFDRNVQQNIREEAALPLGKSLYSTCAELGLANSATVELLLRMMNPDPSKRRSATEAIADIDCILGEYGQP